MCCEIFELDAAIFLAAPGLARQAALKKTKLELKLFTGIYVLSMVERGIRGRMCHATDWYAKANNNYMKNYDKNKELPYIKYWDVYNLFGRAMSQKLPVNSFKCVEDISKFNEGFIKVVMRIAKSGISLKLMLNILKSYMRTIMIYYFHQEE